jgi:hypothetical protein
VFPAPRRAVVYVYSLMCGSASRQLPPSDPRWVCDGAHHAPCAAARTPLRAKRQHACPLQCCQQPLASLLSVHGPWHRLQRAWRAAAQSSLRLASAHARPPAAADLVPVLARCVPRFRTPAGRAAMSGGRGKGDDRRAACALQCTAQLRAPCRGALRLSVGCVLLRAAAHTRNRHPSAHSARWRCPFRVVNPHTHTRRQGRRV